MEDRKCKCHSKEFCEICMPRLKDSTQAKWPKYLFLFYFYACTYVTIEVFFREYSHWTMWILGGLCGLIIGGLNNKTGWDYPLLLQGIEGSLIVTALEFIFGCIFNLWLGMDIWDYTNMPFNLLGQICLPFAIIWCPLSLVCVILDDYLNYWFFDAEKPHYKWI